MNSKPWYRSKTIWAGILVIITVTINAIMEQFGPNPNLQVLLSVISGVAGAFGIYGRAVSTTDIE